MSDERLKNIEERQNKRNKFLLALYDHFSITGERVLTFIQIRTNAQLNHQEAQEAVIYWEDLCLIETLTLGDDERDIALLPRGLRFVEESINQHAELLRGAGQSTVQTLDTMDIFISHANQDAPIAEALAELLRAAFNLAPSRIRCTSVDGYRLDAGDNFNERLKIEVFESRVFIGLITQTSAASAFVLFELGARWGASKPLLPLLAAGAGASALPGPLSGFNALKCESDEQVLQFVRNVGEKLEQTPNSVESYLSQAKTLVKRSRQAQKKERLT